MAEIVVTLEDGLDHVISGNGDEHTICGQPVPMGLPWVTTTTKPCPVCFPDAEPAKPAAKKAKKAA